MSGMLFWAGAGVAIIVGAGVVLAAELRRRDGTGPGRGWLGSRWRRIRVGVGLSRLTQRLDRSGSFLGDEEQLPVVAEQGPQPGDDAATSPRRGGRTRARGSRRDRRRIMPAPQAQKGVRSMAALDVVDERGGVTHGDGIPCCGFTIQCVS